MGVWLSVAAAFIAGAAAATPPLADFGKLPTIDQVSLSPSGDKIAYMVAIGDVRRMVIRKVGGPDLFALNVGALKPREIEWLDNDHVLVEASKTFGQHEGFHVG